MRQGNEICPVCQLIHTFVVNIVGRIETDDAGERRPRAKRSGSVCGQLGIRIRPGVGAKGMLSASVALCSIQEGESRYLDIWLATRCP